VGLSGVLGFVGLAFGQAEGPCACWGGGSAGSGCKLAAGSGSRDTTALSRIARLEAELDRLKAGGANCGSGNAPAFAFGPSPLPAVAGEHSGGGDSSLTPNPLLVAKKRGKRKTGDSQVAAAAVAVAQPPIWVRSNDDAGGRLWVAPDGITAGDLPPGLWTRHSDSSGDVWFESPNGTLAWVLPPGAAAVDAKDAAAV
jgi:hypothetical protein